MRTVHARDQCRRRRAGRSLVVGIGKRGQGVRAALAREEMSKYALLLVAAVALIAAGWGQPASPAAPSAHQTLTLRLGYFPNLTHAPALAGIKKGYFATALGSKVTLEPLTFNAGGDAVTALLA